MNHSRSESGKCLRVILTCSSRKAIEANDLRFEDAPIFFRGNSNLPSDTMPEHHSKRWVDYICAKQAELGYLHRAYELYTPKKPYTNIYEQIHNWQQRDVGKRQFYILSAGFGFVTSVMRIPKYDITFTNAAKHREAYLQRGIRRSNHVANCLRLPLFNGETHLFAGYDYVRAFDARLEEHQDSLIKHVYAAHYAGNARDIIEGGSPRNWHYEAARRFIEQH